ncbi:Dam family site-specific DNA-(adenine-N6)-methyltransferase [Pelotomaculum propionicicum]|uniref:Dam family site-specific DNA-(adenine-N6)-methyltransferase n=1 Tax=Pelotomaculum propionicicum TaxID=258475 RepID=UPI003B7EB68C
MKPFLKWAGSKQHIIERIKAALPAGHTLIEPFAGSCAVFLGTNYRRYFLSDINKDLINLYQTLQAEGEPFIQYCKTYFIEENKNRERFNQLRKEFNTTSDMRMKAALFLYLNRYCYNGLCRYNSKGIFNSPFGRLKPYFPEEEMRNFYRKSGSARFESADFRDVMSRAGEGCVIYADPPYDPISSTANFTNYAVGGFSKKDQVDLVRLARQLAEKGMPVLISNHATEFVLNLYRGADIQTFDVRRYISCGNRGMAREVLALFTPERQAVNL